MLRTILARGMYAGLVLAHKFPSFRPAFQWANNRLVSMMYKTYQKHGEEGWEKFWIPAMREFGRIRAPYVAKTMNIEPNDPSSIGLYHDFEDPALGVVGHWETNPDGQKVRVETACAICDHMEKITGGKNFPPFCHKIMTAFENGTGQAINEKYYIKVHTLLTEGDDACRVSHHFQEQA